METELETIAIAEPERAGAGLARPGPFRPHSLIGVAPPARAARLRGLLSFLCPLGVLVLYFAAGKLGLRLAFVNESATAVWAPTGIALAALLLFGFRLWPVIYIGAFLVNVTTAGSIPSSLGIAAGNTLEGVIGAWLVIRFANGRRAFERPQDVFRFAILAAMGSTIISATVGVSSLLLGGFASWSQFTDIWLTWWLGDAAGALIVAPALLLWFAGPLPRWTLRGSLERLLAMAVLCVVGGIIFTGWLPESVGDHPLKFVCLPILGWVAFRFGLLETATGACLISAIAIWGTVGGNRPVAGSGPNESLLLLQVFLMVVSVTAMVLAAAAAERVRAEEALTQKVLELRRSNAELETFAHIASHDLREPLRMVANFTQLLAKRYRGRLDADADDFMHFIVDGAVRMERMIEDLLAYSRLGAGASAHGSVDCEEALLAGLTNLRVAIEESGAIVTRGPMPRVTGDVSQLVQLFQNLVGNAVKFHGAESPRIHVSAERKGSHWLFRVRDNGIGIDPKQFERVFEMFKRLHDRDAYPGSGIGLAICKKIVERHGGEIGVESEPGRGSTFFFALPVSLRERLRNRD